MGLPMMSSNTHCIMLWVVELGMLILSFITTPKSVLIKKHHRATYDTCINTVATIGACRSGDIDSLILVAKLGAVATNSNRPLREAAAFGHLKVVQYLVGLEEVDVAAAQNYPVYIAATNGHLEVVKFLAGLEGVDVAAAQNYPVHMAAANGHLEVVKFLAGLEEVDIASADNLAVRWAAHFGHLEVVKFLAGLEEVDVTAKNNQAVCWAATHSHYHVVEFLLGIEGVYLADDELHEKIATQWVDEVSEEYWLALAVYNSKFAPLIDTDILRVFVCALSFNYVNEDTLGALALVSRYK